MWKLARAVPVAALVALVLAPAASAHRPICDPIRNIGSRLNCIHSYVHKRVLELAELKAGDPFGRAERAAVATGTATTHFDTRTWSVQRNPHSYFGSYEYTYLPPSAFGTFHTCVGSLLVSGHNGRVVVWLGWLGSRHFHASRHEVCRRGIFNGT
jgi:hypothetical protein